MLTTRRVLEESCAPARRATHPGPRPAGPVAVHLFSAVDLERFDNIRPWK